MDFFLSALPHIVNLAVEANASEGKMNLKPFCPSWFQSQKVFVNEVFFFFTEA